MQGEIKERPWMMLGAMHGCLPSHLSASALILLMVMHLHGSRRDQASLDTAQGEACPWPWLTARLEAQGEAMLRCHASESLWYNIFGETRGPWRGMAQGHQGSRHGRKNGASHGRKNGARLRQHAAHGAWVKAKARLGDRQSGLRGWQLHPVG
jgi:hypothetical protein